MSELQWGIGPQAQANQMMAAQAVEIESGTILFVERFRDCIHFYRIKIGLPVLMEKTGIMRFMLGSMYLQIEDAELFGHEPTRNIILRKNVPSISGIQRELKDRGVVLEVHDMDWGKIGNVLDPCGNKLEYFRKK